MRDAAEIMRLADLYRSDAAAHDAARQAATEAGEPRPRGIGQRFASGIFGFNASHWATTPKARQRFQEALAEQALKGATDYVCGLPGNAYARFLVERFGSVSPVSVDGARASWWRRYAGLPSKIRYSLAVIFLVWCALLAAPVWRPATASFANPPESPTALLFMRVFALVVALVGWPVLALACTALTALAILSVLGVLAYVGRPSELVKGLRELVLSVTAGALVGLALMVVLLLVAAGVNLLRGQPIVRPWADYLVIGSFTVVGFGAIAFLICWSWVIEAGASVLCRVLLLSPLESIRVLAFVNDRAAQAVAILVTRWETYAPTVPLHVVASDMGPVASEIVRAMAAAAEAGLSMPAAPAATSSPAVAETDNSLAPLTPSAARWGGGLHGERAGPKQFGAVLRTELAPLDVLSHVSRTLTQLASVQPWRVVPTVKTSGADQETVSFVAHGTYAWDSRPYVAESDGRTIVVDVSGKSSGGSGSVSLECTVVPCAEDDRVELRLSFSEAQAPMWLRREAEGYVAGTLREVARALEDTLGAEVAWDFALGDWLTYQLLRHGHDPVELRPARGRP
jgi:hypothetical protein